jgi:hypothetical protein
MEWELSTEEGKNLSQSHSSLQLGNLVQKEDHLRLLIAQSPSFQQDSVS